MSPDNIFIEQQCLGNALRLSLADEQDVNRNGLRLFMGLGECQFEIHVLLIYEHEALELKVVPLVVLGLKDFDPVIVNRPFLIPASLD